MNQSIRRTAAASVLVCFAALASSVPAQSPGVIPSHPRELKYPRLDYSPPKASGYRQTLKNGAAGYFVEDHDLPLTNISVIVRVGSYLDPAGKEGLAAATGSQVRGGGTARRKAEECDEEVDFLAANLSSSIGATSGGASVNCLAKDVDSALEMFFDM